MALDPQYIVIHTAAYKGKNCDSDTIDRWHRQKGWRGIGYHYIILNDRHDLLNDGTIQMGRDLLTPGAHTRGLNRTSIGICCVGHGDMDPFTRPQKESLMDLMSGLIDEYAALTVDRVIGHREINRLISHGILSGEYKTTKSCPGKLVDMDQIREELTAYRDFKHDFMTMPSPDIQDRKKIRDAIFTLKNAPARIFPNAEGELLDFLGHPEVISFLEEN